MFISCLNRLCPHCNYGIGLCKLSACVYPYNHRPAYGGKSTSALYGAYPNQHLSSAVDNREKPKVVTIMPGTSGKDKLAQETAKLVMQDSSNDNKIKFPYKVGDKEFKTKKDLEIFIKCCLILLEE